MDGGGLAVYVVWRVEKLAIHSEAKTGPTGTAHMNGVY